MLNKNYILDEIRRTAAANGGAPLGSQRFASETGIKEKDWSGKYWARWGDALIEAGFSPNQFTSAYPEAFLLEKLASLTRELRRFPTSREVKLKGRGDPSFPAETTFRRLGAKRQKAVKLLEFCEGKAGYEPVAEICRPYADSRPKRATSREVTKPEVFNEVYLFKSGRYYKIGRTNAAGRREYEVGIQLPEKLTVVHVIKSDDAAGIEFYWHRRFQDRRKHGEWFDLTPQDVAAFKRRKFM